MDIIPVELQSLSQWLGFMVGIISGLIVQGEAQLYFVHMFEIYSQRTKIDYDLNPLHHFDAWSIPALVFAGWTWSRKKVEEPPYFPHTALHRSLIPLAGPVANLALVGILSTLYLFFPGSFLGTAIAANIEIALANLLVPVPPFALGRALTRPFEVLNSCRSSVDRWGAVVIGILLTAEYFGHWSLLKAWISSIGALLYRWVVNW